MYVNFKEDKLVTYKQYPTYLNNKGLKPIDKLLYVQLLDRIRWTWTNYINGNNDFYDKDKKTIYCIYEIENLSTDLEVSVITIKRSLKVLEEIGLIEVMREKSKLKNNANKYYLPIVEGMNLEPIVSISDDKIKPIRANKKANRHHNFTTDRMKNVSPNDLDNIIKNKLEQQKSISGSETDILH